MNIEINITEESRASSDELFVYQDDVWLQDTEVKYQIIKQKGRWHVFMNYFSIHHPIQILRRRIDSYHSEKKAVLFAEIFMRGIRKDSRGTIKRKKDAYTLYYN